MKTSKNPLQVHQMTIVQFEEQFPDQDTCKEYLTINRWPDNEIRCPRCGNDKFSELATMPCYAGLDRKFPHLYVRHSIGEYVFGAVHTNTIEGFWSIVKRGIVGSFHKVSKRYLQLYVNEFEFRCNNRKNSDVFGTAIRVY